MASKGKPYRTVVVDGYEILVGRGSEENEVLTFDVADPHDVWMHVGDAPGSHVVVRNPSKSALPRAVLESAAAITAWYSKARSKSKVDVSYCLAGQVSKPRGAPMGMVEITGEKNVRVAPRVPASTDAV